MSGKPIAAAALTLFVLSSFTLAARDAREQEEGTGMPKTAKSVVEAKEEGQYKVPAEGRVWLVDTENEKVVHTTALGQGDTYAFNAKEDKVYRNGKELEEVRLDQERAYRIYFLATESTPKPAKEKPNEGRPVPDTAKVVLEGRDKELSYETKVAGMAYLYDASHDQLIETFRLSAGDRVTISPKSNAMSVNGKTVSRDIELDRKVTYKLLFDEKK
jgi:hypothetical protein